MGPAYYVIAIFGCADASAHCTRVATVPARYETEAACAAATMPALMERNDMDFPTLTAECRAVRLPIAGSGSKPVEVPADARLG